MDGDTVANACGRCAVGAAARWRISLAAGAAQRHRHTVGIGLTLDPDFPRTPQLFVLYVTDRPVYGLQAPTLTGGVRTVTTSDLQRKRCEIIHARLDAAGDLNVSFPGDAGISRGAIAGTRTLARPLLNTTAPQDIYRFTCHMSATGKITGQCSCP